MTTPILFTPFVDEDGFRAIRYEGRWGRAALFNGVVTKLASPMPGSWNHIVAWLKQIDAVRQAA